MSETRIPLKFPPGIYHNGTKSQAAGRWYDGNGVRFHGGNIQPIGGWVQRTLTGAAITGRPNAALSWETSDNREFLAVGTTTGLFIVDEDNVVYSIMPGTLVGGSPYSWELTNFGSYLLAVYALDTYDDSNSLNVLVWKGDTAEAAVQAFDGSQGPNTSFGVFSTPERFLIVLRGSDPNGSFRRAPAGPVFDPTGGGSVVAPGSEPPDIGSPTPPGLVFV